MKKIFKNVFENFKEYFLVVALLIISLSVLSINEKPEIKKIKSYSFGTFAVFNSAVASFIDLFGNKEELEEHALVISQPRLHSDSRIDCVEPDVSFCITAQIALIDNRRLLPDVEIHNKTAGEFIDESNQQYDLVFAMRTDPRMWSQGYQDLDFREIPVWGLSGHQQLRNLHRVSKEVEQVYEKVKGVMARNGSLYVSVGLGNDDDEFKARVFLTESLAEIGEKDKFFAEVAVNRDLVTVDQWQSADPEIGIVVLTNKHKVSEHKRQQYNRKKKKKRRRR